MKTRTRRHELDEATLDYYLRKAHHERALALSCAFSSVAEQVRGIFRSHAEAPARLHHC